jgi:hypothetical protein
LLQSSTFHTKLKTDLLFSNTLNKKVIIVERRHGNLGAFEKDGVFHLAYNLPTTTENV